jgi:hypothetical protein
MGASRGAHSQTETNRPLPAAVTKAFCLRRTRRTVGTVLATKATRMATVAQQSAQEPAAVRSLRASLLAGTTVQPSIALRRATRYALMLAPKRSPSRSSTLER